jgi:hypothetical protein
MRRSSKRRLTPPPTATALLANGDQPQELKNVTPLGSTGAPETIKFIASRPAELALDAIIDDARHWHQRVDGQYIYGDETNTYVAIGDPRLGTPIEAQAEAWDRVLKLDDETAQTFLYVMTRDLANDEIGSKTRVTVNEILDYKGLKRHHSREHFLSHKTAESNRLLLLSEIWVAVNDYVIDERGPRRKKQKVRVYSRLIDVAFEAKPETVNKSGVTTSETPYACRLNLGDWATPYRSIPTYVRETLAQIVRYGALEESQRFAMRIGLILMFVNNGPSSNRWKVRDLIARARLQLPQYQPSRFRDRIETALDKLQDDRIIGSWFYDKDKDLPTRGWLEHWLDWTVVIESTRPAISAAAAATGS